jgi:hypothetical protein
MKTKGREDIWTHWKDIIYTKSVRIIYTRMTQTLIHIIPYSRHYTGIAQNNSTYIPHSTTPTQTTTKTVLIRNKHHPNI